jgi:hypothetical protein
MNEIEFNSLEEDKITCKRKVELVYTPDLNLDEKYVLKRQKVYSTNYLNDDVCPKCGPMSNNILKMYSAKTNYSQYDLMCGKCRSYIRKDGITIAKCENALELEELRKKYVLDVHFVYTSHSENYATLSEMV